MKMLRFPAYILVLLTLNIFACGEVEKTPQSSEAETTLEVQEDSKPEELPAEPVDDRPPLYLSGLYATSTAPQSDVRSVLKKDGKAIWKTRKGAGPDEGIMLYFSEETYIKSIRVERATATGLTEIYMVKIYGNGSPIGDVLLDENSEIGQALQNVYLRFAIEKDIERSTQAIETDYYATLDIDRFNPSQQIGIQRIIIEGKDGEFNVIPPSLIAGTIDASSTLKAESFAYDPSLLFDARKEFVWVEGAKGNGEGVTLKFNFDRAVTIAGFQFWNGYQRSESHFKSNARLKDFSFGRVGETMENYTLKDEQGAQRLTLNNPLSGTSFELKIESAYKGWSYKDLAISEILFFDETDALFGLESPNRLANQTTIVQKAKGTVLEPLLDSRVYNKYIDEAFEASLTRSAILRSDGTFVLYSSEDDGIDGFESIADGNWEIIAADDKSATISVFGKLFDFSMLEVYYAGKTDVELGRIFRDKITIKGNTIQGEKLVNAIKF